MPSNKASNPPKMADIARLAGVHASTVSRALAGSPLVAKSVREKILRIARSQGYKVNAAARSLRLQRTESVSVVIPLAHEVAQPLSDPFFVQMIGHLADEVTQRGFGLFLQKVVPPMSDWLTDLIGSKRSDGIIVIGQSTEHSALEAVADKYLPLVVWGAHLPEQAYCSVGSDNVGGGRAAVDRLIETGRRRIVFLGAAPLPEIQMRLQGYRTGLERAGLPVDPELILPAHFTGDTALAAVQDLISREVEFDAVFAASDVIALSALRALQASGISVPDQVAVVGFDDLELAQHSHPRLTTIRQDLKRGAATVVEFLFRRMAGEETPSATLPIALVERESTPPAPGRATEET